MANLSDVVIEARENNRRLARGVGRLSLTAGRTIHDWSPTISTSRHSIANSPAQHAGDVGGSLAVSDLETIYYARWSTVAELKQLLAKIKAAAQSHSEHAGATCSSATGSSPCCPPPRCRPPPTTGVTSSPGSLAATPPSR